jgi:hypothetical protein
MPAPARPGTARQTTRDGAGARTRITSPTHPAGRLPWSSGAPVIPHSLTSCAGSRPPRTGSGIIDPLTPQSPSGRRWVSLSRAYQALEQRKQSLGVAGCGPESVHVGSWNGSPCIPLGFLVSPRQLHRRSTRSDRRQA